MLPVRPTVALLPAAPAEGWASMDRYWQEMERMAQSRPAERFEVTAALPGGAPGQSRRESRLRRAWTKYAEYPRRVRGLRGVRAAHILDHSYAHLLRALPPGVRSVVTVHDLVPLMDPRGLSPGQVRRWTATMRNLRRADLVVAISRPVADELVARLGIRPDRLRHVNMGVDVARFAGSVPRPAVLASLPLGRKLILSVGSVQPRKNLESLPEFFRPLRDRFQRGDWTVVRCGERMAPGLAGSLRELLGPAGFVELGPLYGDDVVGVFQAGSVYLIASMLEGFNLTIMEAMAAGVPVVANGIPSNREVGADAVAYYDDPDLETGRTELRRLLDEPAYAADRRARGQERVQALSWENHWRKLLGVYSELLEMSDR